MNNKIRIFRVGGSVRDALLGIPSKDIDYAVEAPSFDAMREFIISQGGKIFVETPKFLTIRAKIPNLGSGSADFVLCRKDGAYSDGRHPESVEVGTILDDLSRRDFTMNAIAVNVHNELEIIDPFDGIEDIKKKVIRCVGNPIHRFEEDKLRIFRALRFSMTKRFSFDPNLWTAMHNFVLTSDFDSVSTERIREELLKMFAVDSFYAMHLLNEFSALKTVTQNRGIWFKPTIGGNH